MPRYNDGTFVNGYLDSQSLANGFINRNSIINLNGLNGDTNSNFEIHHHFGSNVKSSNKFLNKRISDDSMAHLLLSSANNSPASINCAESNAFSSSCISKKKLQFRNENCEVYEDINLNSMKANDYCYEPTSNVIQSEVRCSLPTSSSSSSSNSEVDADYLENETQPSSMSNIPCLPKTLPPEKGDALEFKNKDDNDYDVPNMNKNTTPNQYASYVIREDLQIDNQVVEEDCTDYQIPINLPKGDTKE